MVDTRRRALQQGRCRGQWKNERAGMARREQKKRAEAARLPQFVADVVPANFKPSTMHATAYKPPPQSYQLWLVITQ